MSSTSIVLENLPQLGDIKTVLLNLISMPFPATKNPCLDFRFVVLILSNVNILNLNREKIYSYTRKLDTNILYQFLTTKQHTHTN